jgi:predicted restriction endonuclease
MPEVLRASHTKPWADCTSDEERLDVFNGILLVANLDALFDRGLITFETNGALIVSARINAAHRTTLQLDRSTPLRWVAREHRQYLEWHQDKVFQRDVSTPHLTNR